MADHVSDFVLGRLRDKMAVVPGIADVHIVQVLDYPSLNVDVDRERAAQMGISERDVANNMLISLSSSGLVAPSYFLNPRNNVNYTVVVKAPPSGFDWADAGIGGAATLALVLLAAGGAALWHESRRQGATA